MFKYKTMLNALHIPVPDPRKPGPDRVSVTADLLSKAGRLVFVAAGAEKRLVVERMRVASATLPAGRATAGVANVQVWFAEDGAG